jgi:aconitate hydratase
LAFTFADKADYDKIQAKDKISFADLDSIAPGTPVTMTVKHEDGSSDSVQLNHTLIADQVKWFKSGSALNYVGSQK